jgi:hypothetical protein
METLIANLSLNKVQKKELAGKKYIVAPVTMILEGVFAGNQGPLYYDGKEISKSVASWNHKPITVGHPTVGGQYVSGCLPETIDQFSVGMVLNTKWNPSRKRLIAEAWFEETRLDVVPGGNRIKEHLTKQEPMEISTGLFVDNEVISGSYSGREYSGKAKNFRPDHLAVITAGVGACSLKDGAGLLVNKQAVGELPTDLQTTVSVSLAVANESRRIVEVDESTSIVIYTEGGNTYVENFTVNNGVVKLLGNRIQVVREVKPLIVNEKVKMKREEIASILGDEHKDFVTNLSDAQVEALGKLQIVRTVEVEKVVEKVVANKAPENLDELLVLAPADVKAKIDEAFAVNASHRDGLVEKIVANEKNQFSKEELAAMPTASLDKLAVLAVNTASASKPAVYAGSAASKEPAAPAAAAKGFLPPSTFSAKA